MNTSPQRYRPEVEEWCYRLMNDPEYFEKFRYIDTINDYNLIIEKCQKLYDSTSASDQFIRAASSLSTMKRAQKELAKTQAEYDKFKKYNARTAISKQLARLLDYDLIIFFSTLLYLSCLCI